MFGLIISDAKVHYLLQTNYLKTASPSCIPTVPPLAITAYAHLSDDILFPSHWEKEDGRRKRYREVGEGNESSRLKSGMWAYVHEGIHR